MGVFLAILGLNLFFIFYSLPKLKDSMINKKPTKESVKEEERKQLRKISKEPTKIIHNPIKKKVLKRKLKSQEINLNLNTKKEVKSNVSKEKILQVNDMIENIKENIIIEQSDDINELPFARALIIDKRNLFKIFISIIVQKLEIIDLFYGENMVKIMTISEFILYFLFNFFFNILLYSDEVVSHKYHNNGKLDAIVTFVLSILSNIITSIVCYYINYSKGVDERWEMISELKDEYYFILNVNRFFKYLKLKFIAFFICEIIVISGCYYYIMIFCIIYKKSITSLIINYLSSLLESLITSFVITIIILATRKIGLVCLNRNLYNTSKFINNKF